MSNPPEDGIRTDLRQKHHPNHSDDGDQGNPGVYAQSAKQNLFHVLKAFASVVKPKTLGVE